MPITKDQVLAAKEVQDLAAKDKSKVIRLVAGPGTGKSFVIEGRVHWLIAEQGVALGAIRAISFTRAAANDLSRRIGKFCFETMKLPEEQAGDLNVSTLHSLALYILRRTGQLNLYPTDPFILDEWESENIFDAEFAYIHSVTPPRAADIRLDHEAYWNTFNWNPANLQIDEPVTQEQREAFNSYYRVRTQLYACVLPGEVVRTCVDQLRAGTIDPVDILKIQHLIVDEAQDLNPCDFEFVHELVSRGVSVLISGDDDQSLYAFRYAFPEGLQKFLDKYLESTNHVLNDCFRCTSAILDAATRLINNFPAEDRIPKELKSLFAASEPINEGLIVGKQFKSGHAEATFIAESCKTLKNEGVLLKDIMILIGNKRVLSDLIKKALTKAGLEFDFNQNEAFFDSRMIRFLVGILRVRENENDYVAYRIVLGTPRGIGIATCTNIGNTTIQNQLNFRQLFVMENLPDVFDGARRVALEKARQNLNVTSMWDIADTLVNRIDEINELLTDNFAEEDVAEWTRYVEKLPEGINLHEVRQYLQTTSDEARERILEAVRQRLNIQQDDKEDEGKIRLMTFHTSKGLDAKIVFIPGLEQNVFPSAKARLAAGRILECARMLYVGITRAKAACILSYAFNRQLNGQWEKMTPSEFCAATGIRFHYQASECLSNDEIAQIKFAVDNHWVEPI